MKEQPLPCARATQQKSTACHNGSICRTEVSRGQYTAPSKEIRLLRGLSLKCAHYTMEHHLFCCSAISLDTTHDKSGDSQCKKYTMVCGQWVHSGAASG